MAFEDSWARIQQETEIKNQYDLAKAINASQPVISKYKKKGVFPVEWAYKVGKKYNLLTEWIMTGDGQKRLREGCKLKEEIFQGSLGEWIKERCKESPEFYREFMADCAAFFPEYAEWLKKRKGGLAESSVAHQSVA